MKIAKAMRHAKAVKSEEALDLLRKYGASDGVIEHVKAVRRYALELAAKKECDRELVEIGALLHDIGRSRTHGIDHAVVGARILRDEGVDERVVKIVERHVGAGISREEAGTLGLPPADYLPRTIEEKIVCQADNLIGSKDRISIHDAIATAEERWSPAGLKRLIQLQYEVFAPIAVTLEKKACADAQLQETIGSLDVLYKKTAEKNKCTIELFGHDAEKAARALRHLAVHPQ